MSIIHSITLAALSGMIDIFNDQKMLFGSRLELDVQALTAHLVEKAKREKDNHEKALEPPSAGESFRPRADSMRELGASVAKLPLPRHQATGRNVVVR
jgi:hypothetical protein